MSWDRLRQVRLQRLARLEADAMDQLYAEPQGSARLLAVDEDETGSGDTTGTGSGGGSGTGSGDATGSGSGGTTGSGELETEEE